MKQKRPGQEENLKAAIIRAIDWYFSLYALGFAKFDNPSTRQQGTDLNKGAGKPYDLGVFLRSASVLLLELKDRQDDNSFNSWEADQNISLTQLWRRGIFVWYAFNGWNWSSNPNPEPPTALEETLVLSPERCASYCTNPFSVQETLRSLLNKLTGDETNNLPLAELLSRDASAFEHINNHSLIVLVDLHERQFMTVNNAEALKEVSKYFRTLEADRPSLLKTLEGDPFSHFLANYVFELKDGSMNIANDEGDSPSADKDSSPRFDM